MNDSETMRMARLLWDSSVGHGIPIEGVARYFRERSPEKDGDTIVDWATMVDWADGGYYTIETSSKFAAALISSKYTVTDFETTPIVRTFMMRLPHGVFADIDRCLVSFATSDGTGEPLAYVLSWSSGDPVDADRRLWTPWLREALDEKDSSVGVREAKSLLRLALGLFITAATPHFVRERAVNGKRGDDRGPPSHRLAVIGRPIACDVRPAVRSYLAGHGRGLTAFQSVVRGHFKRQVVGVGRSARRVIFVEPYWRGPEDAPILVRPHHVEPVH
jgi:hypothetical protein